MMSIMQVRSTERVENYYIDKDNYYMLDIME